MPKIDYALMYVTDDSIRDDNTFFAILEAALKGGDMMLAQEAELNGNFQKQNLKMIRRSEKALLMQLGGKAYWSSSLHIS